MKDTTLMALFGGINGVFIGIASAFLFLYFLGGTYKDGQVDALTGKVHYELVTQADSTREWRVIEGVDREERDGSESR